MGIIENCISKLVFTKADWNFNEITLNGEKIAVLFEIDGNNSLKDICEKLKIGLSDIKDIINELYRLNLISLQKSSSKESKTEEQLLASPKNLKTFQKPPGKSLEKDKKKTLVYRGVPYEVTS